MWVWVGLAVIVGLSFWLRFGAVSRLLPLAPEPDSSMVWMLRAMKGEWTPVGPRHMGSYPPLLPFLAAQSFSDDVLRLAPDDAPLGEHLRAASARHVQLRIIVALFAFLIAPLLFLIARRFMGDGWALLGAAFVATGLLHVAHSSIAKPHAAGATVAWLAILCVLRQVERPTLTRVLLTMGATGLAIGISQFGFFVLPTLVVAALVGWRRTRPRWVGVLAWVAPLAVFIGSTLYPAGGAKLLEQGVRIGPSGHLIQFAALSGAGLSTWIGIFFEHDPVLAAFAALGLLVVLRGFVRDWEDPVARGRWLLVASFVLPYTLLISLDARVVDRYLLPLYPFFALLAVLALRALCAFVPARIPPLLVGALVIALPAWTSVRFTWLGTQPSTLDRLGTWLTERPGATRERIVLLPATAAPVFPTAEALAIQLATREATSQPWFFYLDSLDRVPRSAPGYDMRPIDQRIMRQNPPLSEAHMKAYLESLEPDLIVLEVTARFFWFPGARMLYGAVRKHGELVAVFSGEGGRTIGQNPIDYQDARHLARRVLTADALGPQVEVYRWPPRR